jgi:hypothetical protein
MVEFRWPLELAAGCDFGHGIMLTTMARVVVASLSLLPNCGSVVLCDLFVMSFVSVHDVHLLLLPLSIL